MEYLKHKRKKQNYINNVDFYNAIVEHKEKCRIAESLGKPPPKISNYIGECIMKIPNKLANLPNFYSYSYKEEMIEDGMEDCILRFNSFDPAKSQNPFAYFTQICWFAFLRRIEKEKKQQKIKKEMIRNSGIIHEMLSETQDGDSSEYTNSFLGFLQEHISDTEEQEKQEKQPKMFKKMTKLHMAKLKEREDLEKFALAQTQETVLESEDIEEQIFNLED